MSKARGRSPRGLDGGEGRGSRMMANAGGRCVCMEETDAAIKLTYADVCRCCSLSDKMCVYGRDGCSNKTEV